jgi:hypothetical protein
VCGRRRNYCRKRCRSEDIYLINAALPFVLLAIVIGGLLVNRGRP